MQCTCGYSFSHVALETPRPYKSFAIIDDQHYEQFLQAETNATNLKSLDAIAKASQYTGALMICPECGVVTVNWPDVGSPVSQLVPAKQSP